ncbi:hypothetical protein PSTT_07505 [Puccinia striiformis]|uniref:Uncharacterized protein n=1 Tax=Puccinia striiformis TaxID=27350 RepID=A0A2S4VFU0_9BASI|nr:hypothetical protein PSTT_07505 [Puccinia striiformis]
MVDIERQRIQNQHLRNQVVSDFNLRNKSSGYEENSS